MKNSTHQISAETTKHYSVIDESAPLAALHDIAKDMHAAGGISERTMREYDVMIAPLHDQGGR